MKDEAIEIEKALIGNTIDVLRDESSIKPGESFSEFMKLISNNQIHRIIILFDSEKYFRSINCIKEINYLNEELYFTRNNNNNYKKLILIPKDANCFEKIKETDLINYWRSEEEKYQNSEDYENAHISKAISEKITDILKFIMDSRLLIYEQYKKDNFSQLVNEINFDLIDMVALFIKSIKERNIEQVRKLINSQADINMCVNSDLCDSIHPISIAAQNNDEEMVLELINATSNLNQKDKSGQKPIDYAKDSKIRRIISSSMENEKDKDISVSNQNQPKFNFPIEVLKTIEEKSAVYCVAVLPHTPNTNTTRIGSGSLDKTLKIWDVDTCKCLQVLNGHSNTVYCVAIIPDGRIVSGSWDKTLRVWDADTGKCLQVLTGHSKTVRCVAIIPDDRIVSGSDDNTLRLWDINKGECLQVLTGHSNYVLCVTIIPDGRIISVSNDNTLRVWDIDTGECLQVLTGHSKSVFCVAILQFKFHFVSGSLDKTLRVWNANGQCKQILERHSKGVLCIAVIPDINRDMIISGSADNTLRIWNPYSGECLQVLTGHSHFVYSLAIIPDGRIVSGSRDKTIKIWGET